MKAEHRPVGDPCILCGKQLYQHRVDHEAFGDPCQRCGLPIACHRQRSKEGKRHESRKMPEGLGKTLNQSRRGKERNRGRKYYIGIDGEGVTRKDGKEKGKHDYVMLSASDELGRHTWSIQNFDKGLSTEQCLDLILSLPHTNTKVFAFSFNYDLTMILRDIDDSTLFLLLHSELRPSKDFKGPTPVKWCPIHRGSAFRGNKQCCGREYTLNLIAKKFSVSRGQKRIVIWDIFAFYQSKFTDACLTWKVGTEERIKHMAEMKERRSDFDKATVQEIQDYCFEECRYMATLARKLTDAHNNMGLKLTSYYGAGSSAAAILKKMKIKECLPKEELPEGLKYALPCAFFGGRFENSVIGMIEEEIWGYDIASAYPYQTTFLPCLLHGKWVLRKKRSDMLKAKTALVHYRVHPITGYQQSWGPFPFRTEDGSICFPESSPGGWVWRDEFLAGEKCFPSVEFREAWCWESDCDCQPFKDVPYYYLERLKIGKEGEGIVIKLAVNSIYGKLAQSVGAAQFNNWVWAGLITSGCRAQILVLLPLFKDRSNLLMIATDGIQSRERLDMPRPKDTGTDRDVICKEQVVRKPLGMWEEKRTDKGMFFARPGIYFPLEPTEKEISLVRARGMGRRVLFQNWQKVIDTWKKHQGGNPVAVNKTNVFHGAKSSITRSQSFPLYTRSSKYGTWTQEPVKMSFDPLPKRERINPDGKTLALRSIPHHMPESAPYSNAVKSEEAKELKRMSQMAEEQPDGWLPMIGG